MNWKIILCLLLSIILALSVLGGCTDDRSDQLGQLRSQVEALPTVEEFLAMDSQARQEAYNATQAAYDAYLALGSAEQEKLSLELEKIMALFGCFNQQIMPLE